MTLASCARSCGDLFGRDVGGPDQRRLGAAERRIGDALQLGVGVDRRARQRDRRGQPPPHRGDHTQGYEEKRQRRTKEIGSILRGDRRLAGQRPSAKSARSAVIASVVAATALPRRDKVVSCWTKSEIPVMGFRSGLRRIGDPFERHQACVQTRSTQAGTNRGMYASTGA